MESKNNEVCTVNIKDIIFREDLYPRFEPSQRLIQQYAYSLEYLPPIKISQSNILIDGYHRMKAHELESQTEIKAIVVNVESETIQKYIEAQSKI